MSRRSSANDPESKPISMAELMARAKEHGHDAADRIAQTGRRHGGGKDAVSVAELTGEIPKIRDEDPAPGDAPQSPAPDTAATTPPSDTGAGTPPGTRDISADAIARRSAAATPSTQAYSQEAASRLDPLSNLSSDEREREFERYRNFEDVDHHDEPARKRGLFGRRRRKDHHDAGPGVAGAAIAGAGAAGGAAAAAKESDPPTAGIDAPRTDAIETPQAVEPENPAHDPDPATGPLRINDSWRRPSGPVGPPKSSAPTPPSATGRFPVSGDRPLTGGGTFPAASRSGDRFPTSDDRPATGGGSFPSAAPAAANAPVDDSAPTTGPIKNGAVGMAAAPAGGWSTADTDADGDTEGAADSGKESGHTGAAVAAVAGAGAGAAGLSALRRRRRAGDADEAADSATADDAADHDGVATAAAPAGAAGKQQAPAMTWMALAGEVVVGLAVGVGLFWGFTELWKWNTYFALALTVVVVLALVSLVYVLRKTTDLISILLALAAGLIVTVGPLAILGEWPK